MGGSYFTIDKNKMYRYTVWIKRLDSVDGHSYLGAYGSGLTRLDGTVDTNPYFFYGDLTLLNKWYLIVGYIHPYNDPSTTHLGGIYDPETGNKVVAFNGAGGRTDFKFTSSATQQYHRAYYYYVTNIDEKQYFYGPRVDIVDGTEPSINELLGKE